MYDYAQYAVYVALRSVLNGSGLVSTVYLITKQIPMFHIHACKHIMYIFVDSLLLFSLNRN